jgi:hypothetical protein
MCTTSLFSHFPARISRFEKRGISMSLHRFLLLLVLAASGASHISAQDPELRNSQPFPAHKVIGNVYYVGSETLASFLITTPEGHILINSNYEETVPVIRAGVEKLGFLWSFEKKRRKLIRILAAKYMLIFIFFIFIFIFIFGCGKELLGSGAMVFWRFFYHNLPR